MLKQVLKKSIRAPMVSCWILWTELSKKSTHALQWHEVWTNILERATKWHWQGTKKNCKHIYCKSFGIHIYIIRLYLNPCLNHSNVLYMLLFYACALRVCNCTIIVFEFDMPRVRPSNQQTSIKNWLTILQTCPMPLFLIDAWGFLLIGDRKSSLYLTSITLLGTNMSHFSNFFWVNEVPFRLFGWYWYVSYFPCRLTKICRLFPTVKLSDSWLHPPTWG